MHLVEEALIATPNPHLDHAALLATRPSPGHGVAENLRAEEFHLLLTTASCCSVATGEPRGLQPRSLLTVADRTTKAINPRLTSRGKAKQTKR